MDSLNFQVRVHLPSIAYAGSQNLSVLPRGLVPAVGKDAMFRFRTMIILGGNVLAALCSLLLFVSSSIAQTTYSVNTEFNRFPLRIQVADPICKYFLEKYRLGIRCHSEYDRAIMKLESRLKTSNCEEDHQNLLKSYSYDLIAAVFAEKVRQCTASLHPDFVAGYESSFDRVCRWRNGLRADPSPMYMGDERPVMVFVPGAIQESNDEITQNSEEFLRTVRCAGIDLLEAKTREMGHVWCNAKIVEATLRDAESRGRPYTILALSCGSPEVFIAMNAITQSSGTSNLHSFISISGIPRGTVLADEATQFPKRLVSSLLMKRNDFGGIENLKSMSRTRLKNTMECYPLPAHVQVYSCAPIGMTCTMSTGTKKGFQTLKNLGINDGIVLTRDSWIPGSIMHPLLGTDHAAARFDATQLGMTFVDYAYRLQTTLATTEAAHAARP